jgi:hypothetical protein
VFQGILLHEAADGEVSAARIACLQTHCVVSVANDWTMMMESGTYGSSQ